MDHLKTVTTAPNLVHSSIELDVARRIRILLVEDDETIAAIAREMLEEQGWQVHTCNDGNVAIEHISGGIHYDSLLVDYGLPGINGLELVQRARKLVHHACTPIVMLSATPVGLAAREAGADVFLQKPQDVISLVETIGRLLRPRDSN